MIRSIRWLAVLGLVLALAGGAAAQQAKDPEASALSWQKQAADTRAAVVGVAEELGALDLEGDAAQLFEDAKQWLEKGDAEVAKAEARMQEESFQEASYAYNMAWQYYVKAATAGLNAKRLAPSR
jgi:Asp-tRNA(Asn)/Glu-tRNA(Gln) amidotransferase A subunit family amidase